MGIGLVDPILKPIADNLNTSASQVSLLFTSYMAVMGVAMLITGVVASRIGPKRTLLLGLVVIIAGAGPGRNVRHVLEIVGWQVLWGLGNALLMSFTPFPLDMTAHQIGLIFSGWGLALPFTSVVIAAPVRYCADTAGEPLGDVRRHRGQGRVGDVWWSPACSSESTTP